MANTATNVASMYYDGTARPPLLTRHFGCYGEPITMVILIGETRETIRSTVRAIKSQTQLLTEHSNTSQLKNIEIGLLNNLRRIEWINNRIEYFTTLRLCMVEELIDSDIYQEYLDVYPKFELDCNSYFDSRVCNIPIMLKTGV